jgi:superfamily II DNA helicase RecQ
MVQNLRLLACPIVLLTATLPPVREGELAASMLVTNATYIRASTVRPNTRYFVSWCKRRQAAEVGIAMGKRQVQGLQRKGQRGVVYCKSRQQCEEVAKALGCAHYHAGLVDRSEKLEAWADAGGLIVATSALGTGVDFPGIVFILHIGMPWSMLDYAQESGRGGRAGEQVDAVVVVEEGEVEEAMRKKSEDIDVQAMGQFLMDGGCRRELMSRYLDGKGVRCGEAGGVGCDRCGEGVEKWMEERGQWEQEWEMVEKKFHELRQGCVVCWLLGVGTKQREEWKDHRTMQCERNEGVRVQEMDGFRVKIRDGGGTHSCRRCWVSQKYCAMGEDVMNRCQWPNVVVPLAYVGSGTVEGVGVVRKCGFEGEDAEEYAKWLGQRHKVRV